MNGGSFESQCTQIGENMWSKDAILTLCQLYLQSLAILFVLVCKLCFQEPEPIKKKETAAKMPILIGKHL